MKIKSLFVTTLAIAFSCVSTLAQNQPSMPVSPEAASLAKMVNYPVNMNTGVPNISLPLYQIQSGGMTLPVTLNYHAGGFKINERATSVGLGWSSSADLQITRSINGLDDFTPVSGYIGNNLMKAGYLSSLDCPSCEYPLQTPNPFIGRNQYDIATGNRDGMPDKFNYKLLNKSGSFYFQKNDAGNDYVIVPVPFDNIKITFNNGQFNIVDTDGTSYVFGGQAPFNSSLTAAKGVEFTNKGGVGNLTGWKCRKITNATETDSIKFTYQQKTQLIFNTRVESVE